jgi:predicted Zn-dependent protease
VGSSPVEVLRASAAEPVRLTKPKDDALALVAECLERNDLRAAAIHLDGYVREHPDQFLFRLQLAELYAQAEQPAEAKFHYERFALDAQDGPPALQPHRVTAHTRLMEIAQRRGDRFGELLHRGVGLLLLVKQMDGVKDHDEGFCEEMLCKSLKALQEAKELKPADPRVRVYLAEAHARAGNRSGANAERAGAREGVTCGELTPRERKPLLE